MLFTHFFCFSSSRWLDPTVHTCKAYERNLRWGIKVRCSAGSQVKPCSNCYDTSRAEHSLLWSGNKLFAAHRSTPSLGNLPDTDGVTSSVFQAAKRIHFTCSICKAGNMLFVRPLFFSLNLQGGLRKISQWKVILWGRQMWKLAGWTRSDRCSLIPGCWLPQIWIQMLSGLWKYLPKSRDLWKVLEERCCNWHIPH